MTSLLAAQSLTFAPVAQVIAHLAAGRIAVLVDDTGAQAGHETGALIAAADAAGAETVNFMARFGRGLICLCLTDRRIRALDLGPMAPQRGPVAFAPSINAAEMGHNPQTGAPVSPVSALGRARTIAAAIDPSLGAQAVVTPGHVLPICTREGGVLERAGLPEAALDLARMAGSAPAAVLCQIMDDDGATAGPAALAAFAAHHSLPLASMRELIGHRRRADRLTELVEERRMETGSNGLWTARTYRNRIDGARVIALVKGKIPRDAPTMVRIHVPDPFADLLDAAGPRHGLLSAAMARIAENGHGVIVLIDGEAAGGGKDTPRRDQLRDYGMGAEVLTDLGVRDMLLLTNSDVAPAGLDAYGLRLTGKVAV